MSASLAGFFDDAWDTVTAPVRWAGDALESSGEWIRQLPGFEQASDAIIDFAKTPVGLAVFRAMSTSLYGPLAFAIGPQLAAVSFAIPGLIKGDDFDKAWLTEVSWRSEEAAKILAPGIADQYAPELADALEKVVANNPDIKEGLASIAKRLDITREDVTYLAMQKLYGVIDLISPPPAFDPETGQQKTWVRSLFTQPPKNQMVELKPTVFDRPPKNQMVTLSKAVDPFSKAPRDSLYAVTAPAPATTRPRVTAGVAKKSSDGSALPYIAAGLACAGVAAFVVLRSKKKKGRRR